MTNCRRIGMFCLIGAIANFGSGSSLAEGRREGWVGSRFQGTPEAPAAYGVEPAFPKLKFELPVLLAAGPGSARLFVAELKGKVVSFQNDRGSERADVAIDLLTRHPDLTALYGMAFAPDFAKSRYVYLCYVLKNDLPDGSVVARFRVRDTDPPTIDGDSEEVILTFWSGGHNGGCLAFGNDGCLYISTGDGAGPSPPDTLLTGQDCSDLLSSILRIDVKERAGKRYRVPADNPFVNVKGARGEIWAFGLRNPWRMSVDRATGELWVGDVGWELWESVMKVERGHNYGWSVMEGPQPVHAQGRVGPAAIVRPIKSHPHSEAASITGGYVYRGTRFPELVGAYVYGDFMTGTVWGLRASGQAITWQGELARTPIHLVAFGADAAGELYLVDHDRTQQIYTLMRTPAGQTAAERFPKRLSETGLFGDTAAHRVAQGVVPYDINSEMWSDGVTAERFVAVPGSGQILDGNNGFCRFPEGTVLGRTVYAGAAGEGGALGRRRVETQVLHLEADAWRPYSYLWDDDQRDARLVGKEGVAKKLAVGTPHGRVERSYRVSARQECLICHNPWVEKKVMSFGVQSASPLGMNLVQLNRLVPSGNGRVEQLTQLYQNGLLANRPEPGRLARLVDPNDASANLEARARSYLQTNCAHCHERHAGGTANIALGFGMTLTETNTVGVKPIQGTFEIDQARIIAAGEPERSVLYYRVAKMGGGRMPRLGSSEVDVRGVKLIHDWIAGMGKDSGASSGHGSNSGSDHRDLEVLASDESAGLAVKRDAIGRLAGSTRGALVLLGLIDDGRVSTSLQREIVAAGRKSGRIEVRDLFERFVPEAERVARLGDSIDRPALLGVRGDAGRGKAVFFESAAAQCKTCHRVNGAGELVGPELSKIGVKYSRDLLLEHILEPSKTIDPSYVSQLVELKDGRVVSGVVVERGAEAVRIRDAHGKLHVIARGEIEQMAGQGRSLMPEGLLRDLTVREAADLLEYLAGLK